MKFTAFSLFGGNSGPVRASRQRDWMDTAHQHFPYRCLPLVIANQHGWMFECPDAFEATWDGRPEIDAITIPKLQYASTHFGFGVLTFNLPWLFRTAPGVNLYVHGPDNHIKDGIQALCGIVETDWLPFTFTMNWKFTRPGTIRFEKGEPCCMVTPVDRGLIEEQEPEVRGMGDEPILKVLYGEWSVKRDRFNKGLARGDEAIVKEKWQKDYSRNAERRSLTLREFEGAD